MKAEKNLDGEAKTPEIQEVVKDIKQLVDYARSLGMKDVIWPDKPVAARDGRTAKGNSSVIEEGLDKGDRLKAVSDEIGDCKRCKLCNERNNIVFGIGNPDARLMFIGEGPGRDEDIQGEPFVGAAGQLLTKIIHAMGMKREDVYIANVVKCRPPNNRNPEPDEVATCKPFLVKQVEIIQPEVIVCLGGVAAQNLLDTVVSISRMRGKFTEWNGIPVMPTYHPAFLLRNANMKKPVWEDMQLVMKRLAKDANG